MSKKGFGGRLSKSHRTNKDKVPISEAKINYKRWLRKRKVSK